MTWTQLQSSKKGPVLQPVSPWFIISTIIGTTHVAVGFLDLGSLATVCLAWQECIPSARGTGPLRWVGYDSSPYAVAKTLVIAAMLQSGCVVDQILQVSNCAPVTRSI